MRRPKPSSRSKSKRWLSNLKNDFEVAEARERQLAQNMAQLKEQEVTSKDAGVDLKELEREAATSKKMLESLLTRYKQTSGTQDFQLPDAHIVEKADTPLYPASPKRKQIVLIAGIGGLIMGLGLAVLLEMMAPGISRSDDIPARSRIASHIPARGKHARSARNRTLKNGPAHRRGAGKRLR